MWGFIESRPDNNWTRLISPPAEKECTMVKLSFNPLPSSSAGEDMLVTSDLYGKVKSISSATGSCAKVSSLMLVFGNVTDSAIEDCKRDEGLEARTGSDEVFHSAARESVFCEINAK
jgi:hypothetical protein